MNLQSGTRLAPSQPDAPCLLVHGGAWAIPQDETEAHLDGLRQAIARGKALLLDGTLALEVVAETVAVLESNGAFDAGRGAVLTQEGTVELDAGVMDGTSLEWGAIAGVQHLANPILVAHQLAKRSDGTVRLFMSDGAERFAEAEGFDLIANDALICERERQRHDNLCRKAHTYHTSHPFLPPRNDVPRGTVGCVARDRQGRLAAATSTGGTPFRPTGRVGDTPLPGCGFYASEYAAASATGWGEAIATVLLSGRATDAVAAGHSPEEAAQSRLAEMHARVCNREGEGGTGGIILLDKTGRGAWAFTTPRMARGAWHEGGEVWVAL